VARNRQKPIFFPFKKRERAGIHGFKNLIREKTEKGSGSRITGLTGGRTGDVINNLINYFNII
jgi:hypothetical protein